MVEKVKVTREVAEVIDFYKKKRGVNWKSSVLKEVASAQSDYPSTPSAIVLESKYSLYELAEILVKDYEVELTPHEKIHEIYKEAHEGAHGIENIRFHEGVAYGVFETLKALGEKVEGIFE